MTHQAFVALGANLDDPAAQVRAALAALDRLPQTRVAAASSLYRTAPIGLAGQPDFINAVAELRTGLAAEALLDALLATEADFGRVRAAKNGPRTLDLDLLLYDQLTLDRPRLHLPHPRLHLRAFVVVPLAEIAPDCRIPGRGTVAAWLPAVATQRIERLR
ncbi:2-amino-4-hydroxy-6-hydroxymethyldihydropteridine diphosphokinase [Azospira restricta]|uniref:2-amino-4-hydroxy-6-hydroxymethyldihydropteridine pyrophosphokinase n=1 Tax=Azospira restricta TaxID=404405 RepID=A0A974PY17_9RHOO|nr:2-amino-4-hydroxy-6-hydroxymethyldihydropteridine diphosphokinase [Azospira restricta]QRJ63567.1 2-amino-4-hydroxy-6-hydroxymethyldihydropteridine diphosphokinase [Azospira restricta]